MKDCDILGRQYILRPSCIFSVVRTPPTPHIYAPAQCTDL